MRRHPPGHRDRGAVIPIVAMLLGVILVMTAFAVDLGRQRSDRRTVQAVADVVALDMSRLADGRTISEITAGSGVHPPALTALQNSADRNDFDWTKLTLTWGEFDDTVDPPVFNPLTGSGDIPDAARIVAQDTTDYFFQPGSGDVSRTAIARYGAEPQAGFKVGSFGASLSPAQSTFLATYVSPLLGNPATLTAVGYEGLAGASVNLGDLSTELGFVTPEEMFESDVTLSDAMLASAALLRADGNDAEADILEGAITNETDGTYVDFAGMVSAEGGGPDSGFNSDVDVLGMIQAAAVSSTCQPHPNGFDDCSGIVVPNLQTPLPLLPATTAGVVKVIQGPQYHYGPVGTGIDTGQIQLALMAGFGSQFVGTCVPSLANLFCVVDGLLVDEVDAIVRIDGLVQLFGGHNENEAIYCQDPDVLGLDVGSSTQAYTLALTVTVEFGPRGLLGGLLSSTLGSMQFTLSTNAPNNTETVPFVVPPDILGETTYTTGSSSAGLSGLTITQTSGTGVLGDLGDLGINTTATDVFNNLVNPILADIDSQYLTPLTQMAGVNVTGSDITAQQIDCNFGSVQLVG